VSSGGTSGNDPCMAEVLAEEALFDGAGGRDVAARANCCGRSGPSVGDGGDVQHASKFAESIKDGGTRTSEVCCGESDSAGCNGRAGALFGDKVPMPWCLRLLGPDAAEPDAPAFEIVSAGFIAAMVNRDSRVVAQENDVALLADDGVVKTIDLFSCVNDDVGDGFFRGHLVRFG